MGLLHRTLLALPMLLVVMTLQDAQATDICWVERVQRSATGIDVHFMDGRTVTVFRSNVLIGRYSTYSAKTTMVRQYDGVTPVEKVPARLGDRLFSSNSPHDSCSLTVVIRDGKIGLEANAAMQGGPFPPSTAQKFIPAE